MRHPFLVRLDAGPLLADGAIGTLLHERGVPWRRSIDAVTLTDRALLSQMHVDYLLAGAELLTTNTFGSNRVRLAEHGLADRVRDLNLHAVKVAREAREVAGRSALVAGAVGSIVRGDVERSAAHEAEHAAAYREQVAALLEGGADAIHLETFTDLDDIALAISAVRAASDLPVIASVSFDHELRAAGDATPEHVAERLLALEVDVVGINCSVGPHHALETLERMRAAGAERVAVMPNAGLPSRQGATFLYRSTPDYFAEYARRFVDAGASIVGGCCGTTPRHTAAMALALEDVAPMRPRPAPSVRASAADTAPARTADAPTELAQALDRGDFVVSVELAPPKGVSAEKVLDGARMLEARGLRFVNVTDSAMARVRMGAIAVARLVQEHTSLEAVIHFTTRDRNLMALQSDLLGAHALGVRNVLALTGDPPSIGDYPDAAGVWDLESPGLVEALRRMNEGTDLRGRDIGGAASFCVGAAVNPTAEDLPLELERLTAKVAAGAQFVMSQPLYDMATLERFLERVDLGRRNGGIPFLLGILPLQSARHAEYMHHEVPGIEVPDALRTAMADAGAEGTATGIALAQEFIAEARSLVDGVYLMPSFGRYELCAHLLDAIGAHA
ncbi:MAG: homocysteine S-methyltransferase [Thermoleophilia bacterium]|nr:homocysteine S-methyltransferase [Thermoleophilia bacterium]